ncbi:heat-inducible transcriptional repressor HrcA [Xanthomonas oryzae pv. oryzae]|nr:heat-inducible transcriptional repressor HrcA [Xanthomonas oryzae]URJ82771.1 heat-inducible transcriptional repressor HrcA [Xanthomonas oryzae pv. oryzae]
MLDPRTRQLLRTLIARYIRDGEPVGSKTLAQHAGLDVSPATIRNILADLEDVGLLSSPHTSAGRVPTAHGYRVFVDSLVQMQPPGEEEIEPRRAYEPAELERVANYLNAQFAGRALADIRACLLRELRMAKNEMEQLLAHSVDLASEALVPADADDMVMAGQTRLMGVQDLSDLDRLRELFEVFASKREILQLLERTIQAPGVRIFIGEETGMVSLEDVSLVTAPYTAHGQVLGVLGVIGPKRMAYDRLIPLVQTAADVLGAAMESPGTR